MTIRAPIVVGLMLAVMPMAAMGQAIPSTAEAGRFEKALKPIPQAQSTGANPTSSESEADRLVPPPGAEKALFVLHSIHLDGATRYPEDDLLAPYQPLIGTRVSIAKIYEIATEIRNRYRRDGYNFVELYLPPQTISGGNVTIRVIEGYVHSVVYENVTPNSFITQSETLLKAEKPLSAKTLEEQMLLLNDLPGLAIRAVIAPDRDAHEEGALQLKLIGSEKRFDGYANINTYGSRYTGPWQGLASVSVNDLTGRNDRTTLSALSAAPYREGHFYSVEHREMLDLRTSMGIRLSQSHNEPGYVLTPQEIRSDTQGVSLDVQHQALRTRGENLSLRASFDINNYATDILGTDLYRDRIRALRVGGSYDMVDRWNGTSLLSLTVSQGLNAFGARQTGDSDLSRAEGHGDFTKLEMTAWHQHPLSEDFSVYASIGGQLAASPLLAAEEFGFGGGTLGRAYDVAEISGDDGIAGSLELRYVGLPSWEEMIAQPYLFYDSGWVWNLDTHGDHATAASAGVGVRMQLRNDIQAGAVVAWPLRRDEQAPLSGDGDDPRFGVNFSVSF